MDKKPLPSCITAEDTVVLFDGVCHLCSNWSRFVIKRDPKANLKLTSLQSDAGQEILKWAGLPTSDFDTMVVVDKGQVLLRSNACLCAVKHLSWPWPLLTVGVIVPRFIRDFFYNIIAKNRYRIFGKSESCMMPTPEIRQRFL